MSDTTKTDTPRERLQSELIHEESTHLTVDAAIENAEKWIEGHTFDCSSRGWRINNVVLANEVKRLRSALQDIINEPSPDAHTLRNIAKRALRG